MPGTSSSPSPLLSLLTSLPPKHLQDEASILASSTSDNILLNHMPGGYFIQCPILWSLKQNPVLALDSEATF
ncbi:hypothetical protein Bpfe_030661 [Biomphalaria pfeifferi]|uniref:Uncharacterized protein n=1 Tax=Biomphalaria pfeifferi TaxID=112525 RepID=A0AAD8AQ70_BIOPF|nr:hypothetical protein Bpfe_030661 [Biomphalaria pfeifferi]